MVSTSPARPQECVHEEMLTPWHPHFFSSITFESNLTLRAWRNSSEVLTLRRVTCYLVSCDWRCIGGTP